MITKDLEHRLTPEAVLKHSWFKNIESLTLKEKEKQQKLIDKNIIKNIKDFRGASLLKKVAMNVLIKLLMPQQIANLKRCFEKYDTDFSGFIEMEEVIEAIKQASYDIS